MQNHWLRHNSGDSVVVFVLGWSCDQSPIEHLIDYIPDSYDIVCLFDYRTIAALSKTEIQNEIMRYKNRYLFAWSFGVWVAEQIFAHTPFNRAMALCGSPHPVDKCYGIEPKRLSITIKGVSKHGSDLFNQKTYGSFYDKIKTRLNPRDTEANIDELENLYSSSSVAYIPNIEWNSCIIGSHDEIFPQENLVRYWGIRAQVLPLPHFPFENAQLIIRELDI